MFASWLAGIAGRLLQVGAAVLFFVLLFSDLSVVLNAAVCISIGAYGSYLDYVSRQSMRVVR